MSALHSVTAPLLAMAADAPVDSGSEIAQRATIDLVAIAVLTWCCSCPGTGGAIL